MLRGHGEDLAPGDHRDAGAVRRGLEGLGRRRSSIPPPIDDDQPIPVHARPASEDSSVRPR